MSVNEDLVDANGQDRLESNLRETVFNYLRYWKWFLFSIIFFLGLGYTYLKFVTPEYKIETDLLIKPDEKSSAGGQNDLLKDLDLFSSDKIIDNEVQILKSKDIIERIIRALNLQTSYYTTNGVRKREVYGNLPFEARLMKPMPNAEHKDQFEIRLINSTTAEINGKKIPLNLPYQTSDGLIIISKKSKWSGVYNQMFRVQFNDIDDLIEKYSEQLKVDPASKQATVLIITIEDAIPQRGEDFLNKLIDEYNLAAIEDKNIINSSTLSFINGRLDTIKETLGSVEQNVERYKSRNQIANIGSQSQILLQGVGENDAQLNKVIIQQKVLKNLQDYLSKNDNNPSNLPSMLGVDDAALLGLVASLGEVQQRKLSLLQTVQENNPIVKAYDDQITALKRAINVSVQNLATGLEVTRKQLENKNNQFESSIRKVPSQERGLLDVMRQQHLQDTLYMYLLQKREETAMKLASEVPDSRTIDHARSSKLPVKPVKTLVYALFLMIGIFIPAGIIYLMDLLNFRISKKSDIEKFTTVPIMAEISHSESQNALLVVEKPRSIVAEQIRAFRTNLQFVIPRDDQKTILFTSSISGEGKSFISLNLGSSLVMSGKKVVILELDLRKPKLHSSLDINNTIGLSTYLIGKVSHKEITLEIPLQKGYFIIPSGPIPPNPAELLSNGSIGQLITDLKKDFDYIILDAPPVGLVTDAQILGAYADATMFIVRHNYTAKSYIHSIENLHKNQKFKNLNIILNSIKFQEGYGYGYGYSYGYGDGGYYQDEDADNSSGRIRKIIKRRKS